MWGGNTTMTTLKQIREALIDIAQNYHDPRIHHCQIEVTDFKEDHCILSGAVLDAETRAAVTKSLSHRWPGIMFDANAVQLLRVPAPQFLTVSTNVASVYAKASFLSEMMSQALNGRSVELLQADGKWVYTRQTDGYLGWVYRGYLSAAPAITPTHIVSPPVSLLRRTPDAASPLLSRVAGGTLVWLTKLTKPWAQLTLAGDLKGWLPLTDLRAMDALPQGEKAQRRQMLKDAEQFTGVPYLWGGCTAFGIDCSGFVQLLHRLAGQTIPRDADMQYQAGQAVEPPFQPGDLLFFGGESKKRSITHVGMSLDGWHMAHASIARNGVYTDNVQAVKHLREQFVGARTFQGVNQTE